MLPELCSSTLLTGNSNGPLKHISPSNSHTSPIPMGWHEDAQTITQNPHDGRKGLSIHLIFLANIACGPCTSLDAGGTQFRQCLLRTRRSVLRRQPGRQTITFTVITATGHKRGSQLRPLQDGDDEQTARPRWQSSKGGRARAAQARAAGVSCADRRAKSEEDKAQA